MIGLGLGSEKALFRGLGGVGPPAVTAFESMQTAAYGEGDSGATYIIQPTVDGTVAIYQDAAGTVPAAAQGDPIKYIVDLSGNGLHAIQNDANPAGLTLNTDGEVWWAVSDATANRPIMPAGAFTASTRSLVMGYTETGTDNAVMYGAVGDTGSALFIALDGSTSSTINANVTYTGVRSDGSAVSLPSNRQHVWDIVSGSTTFTITGLNFAGTFITDATILLGYDSSTWMAEGTFRGVVFTDKDLSGADLEEVEAYVSSLAWPNKTFDLYVAAGQSNAEGRGDSSLSPTVAANTAYEFTGTGLVQLNDPVGGADTGSAWPAFCDGYLSETGNIPVILNLGVSGSSQHPSVDFGPGSWEAEGALVANLISEVNAMKAYLDSQGITYRWRGILWNQGERDAQQLDDPSYDEDIYETAFLGMFDKYKAELGVGTKLWWSRLGERGNDTDPTADAQWDTLRAKQDSIASATAGVYMAFTGASTFLSEGKMADEYHYTQAGYNEMGTAMQASVVATP